MSVSDDAFLGGELRILQPRQGYRAGLDAVMLAAARDRRGRASDPRPRRGRGCRHGRTLRRTAMPGRDAWCWSSRSLILVELARENIARNGPGERVSVVEADMSPDGAGRACGSAGLAEGSFDRVIANPPYHAEGAGTAGRQRAEGGGARHAGSGARRVVPLPRPHGAAGGRSAR